MLPYELVAEMLHKSYRGQTLSYFAKHNIKWWSSKYDVGRPPEASGEVGLPTGHLNSSQVAAVNHLEPARADRSVALRVLANVDPSLIGPVAIEDDGFVAYEWIGAENYLREPGPRTRGAQVTSLDAVMCARRADDTSTLVAFEWTSRATVPSRGRHREGARTESPSIVHFSTNATARSPSTIRRTSSTTPTSS